MSITIRAAVLGDEQRLAEAQSLFWKFGFDPKFLRWGRKSEIR